MFNSLHRKISMGMNIESGLKERVKRKRIKAIVLVQRDVYQRLDSKSAMLRGGVWRQSCILGVLMWRGLQLNRLIEVGPR